MTILGLGAIVIAVIIHVVLRCNHDSDLAFLPKYDSGEWIVCPTPINPRPRPFASLDGVFQTTFTLDHVPTRARLSARAFRSGSVQINSRDSGLTFSGENWKQECAADVAPLLHVGQNTITATIRNTSRPALWLQLELPDRHIVSDGSWEASLLGASFRRVYLAREGPPQYAQADLVQIPSPWRALVQQWRSVLTLASLTLIAAVVCGLVTSRWRRANPASQHRVTSRLFVIAFVTAAVSWICLIGHNNAWLDDQIGFDAPNHLEYVEFIRARHALPLPHQGTMFYQAPLYYMLAAVALDMFDLTIRDANSISIIRGLNVVIGIANLGFVLAALRLLFADRPSRALVGFVVAAALPALLLLHHFPTNELLGAMTCSGMTWLALLVLNRPDSNRTPSFALFALLPLLVFFYLRPPLRIQGTLLVSGVKAFGQARSWKTMLRHVLFIFRML
jgi:hypothetical protein